MASPKRSVFEARVSSSVASEPAIDNVDGSGVLSKCDVDVSNSFRRSTAEARFRKDDGSKVVFTIVRKSFENDLQVPLVRSWVPISKGELSLFQKIATLTNESK